MKRDELRDDLRAVGLVPVVTIDYVMDRIDAYIAAVRADAWDEGCDAGAQNEHEFRPSRLLQNPYREGGAE